MTKLAAGLLSAAMVLGAATHPALGQQCAQERFEGTRFVVCTVDPRSEDLRLFWQDGAGEPYRHFQAVAQAVADDGGVLALAVNGGMYGTDYSPTGLYIEDGQELRAVNTASVEGPPAQVPNFYKKPNGIFFFDDLGAGVLPTEAFLSEQPDARFATQSGPMLVIEGELHPAFIAGSNDRARRSGVGVCEGGLVRFVVSDDRVNFHDFARLFRDPLQCPNALFLDGGQGAGIYQPALRRNDKSWHGGFGPIIGIVE